VGIPIRRATGNISKEVLHISVTRRYFFIDLKSTCRVNHTFHHVSVTQGDFTPGDIKVLGTNTVRLQEKKEREIRGPEEMWQKFQVPLTHYLGLSVPLRSFKCLLYIRP